MKCRDLLQHELVHSIVISEFLLDFLLQETAEVKL